MNLQWPNVHDFIDDENQDVPEEGQRMDSFCDRVSDLGIPVSDEGRKALEKLDKEVKNRNQDRLDMHIYEDWNGWGVRSVLKIM